MMAPVKIIHIMIIDMKERCFVVLSYFFLHKKKNKTLTLIHDRKSGSNQLIRKRQTFLVFLPSYRNTREGITIKYRKTYIGTQNFILLFSS